ncbi:MAG: hypothetical protein IJN97_02815 [Oscillospiraceae bacterium]|nr:hypothetical protein [Oscillospiraceae bacterium]
MFDETNQMMEGSEVELPENLFEDEDVGEESADAFGDGSGAPGAARPTDGEDGRATESEQTREDGADGADQTEGTDGSGNATIRVKYNGEEKDISLDEARTLAQKGLNYDHVVQERDRNRSAFDFLLERAKGEGITVEELIEREKGRAENRRLEAKMEELRKRDDDASEDTIKNLARLELEAEKTRIEREKAIEAENKKNEEIEGWKRLFKEHPELIEADGSSKVSKGVFDLVEKGYSPTEAYYIERNRELEERNKVLTSAETAKKKSVGSLSGVQSTEEDDFLAGFNEA